MRKLLLSSVVALLASSNAFAQEVSPIPGCHDGRLTDARAYFYSVINRQPGEAAADYVGVLAQSGLEQGPGVGVRAGNTHFGLTQQIAAEGPRGVLFLPTDIPDENGYYTRQVLVISDLTTWTWVERFPTRPPYAPRACQSRTDPTPPSVPPSAPDISAQLTALYAQHEMLLVEVQVMAKSLEDHRKVSRSLYDRALGFFKDPRTITTILGIVGGILIPGGN